MAGYQESGSSDGFSPNTKLIDLYIRWIEQFDIRHARAWGKLFKADPEAAMCEATFWGVLQDCGVAVEPYERNLADAPSPDFLCRKDGEHFYVEVTCLCIDHVSRTTSLSHLPTPGAQNYAKLNRAIFNEVVQKTRQCAGLDGPALVAVGTFHYQGSVLCVQKQDVEMLLTGDSMISWLINTDTGAAVGDVFLSTNLASATFIRPADGRGIEEARLPVSGVLVGGFGCDQVNVYGLLHPHARRPFNRQLLERVKFCELVRDDAKATLSVRWI